MDAEYPFTLTTGRSYFHWHTGTMTRRTHLLDREERTAFVEVNSVDARAFGIKNRDRVIVTSRRGEVTVQAKVTDTVPLTVLFMAFHFVEGAANALTNNELDPESHIPEFKVAAVRIRRGA